MALEELMGVEKDAHADTWGAGAVEQGRFWRTYTWVIGMSVAAGRICGQYGREEEGSEDLPSRRCVGENGTGKGSGPSGSYGFPPSAAMTAWMMHLLVLYTHRPKGSGRIYDQRWAERKCRYRCLVYIWRGWENEESNPSKASAQAPASIYSGVIIFSLSTTSVSICVRGIKEKKLSI